MNLSLVETINLVLTSIQILLIIIATMYGLSQLRENTRARQADVIDRVFEYATSKDIRFARKSIRKLKLPSDLNRLKIKQVENIELVLVGWARVGVLLRLKTFSKKDEDILFHTYSWSVVDSWERLKRYVYYTRGKVGMPDYWDDFEHLANCSRDWRIKNKLPVIKLDEKA